VSDKKQWEEFLIKLFNTYAPKLTKKESEAFRARFIENKNFSPNHLEKAIKKLISINLH
jgi:hypothetical protein